MCRPAKNKATKAPAIRYGRYGSSHVRFPIHAPLKPRATRTRGPRQQVEAKMAAKPPAKSAPEPVRLVSTLTWPSPFCRCSFPSELGNERTACASLVCNSAEPHAAHAPISGDRRPSAEHRLVFLRDGGARGHKVASGSVAIPRGRELLLA